MKCEACDKKMMVHEVIVIPAILVEGSADELPNDVCVQCAVQLLVKYIFRGVK